MRPELAAIAARQHGLVTRRQALETGYVPRELRTLVRPGGDWVVVARGVYMERRVWDGLAPYDGAMLARDRAAEMLLSARHVFSHDSAARAHGMDMLKPEKPLVHISRRGRGGGRTDHGVKHHFGRELPTRLVLDGRPVTSVARTALDLAREHGFEQGVMACDWALASGVTRGQLEVELAAMENFPWVSRARAAAAFADPGAESLAESLGRILVTELGVGEVETQFPVLLANGAVVWCDLRVGCHVFEVDGKVKYLRPAQGGVARKPIEEVVWDERTRQNAVCARGLGASRILWEDFWGEGRKRALRRLASEYAVTEKRFGPTLPEELARFARKARPRRRPRRFRRAS